MLRASTWTGACAAVLMLALPACNSSGGGGGGGGTPPTSAPTPAGPMSLSTSSENLSNTGSTGTFTANETGYSGTFTVTLDQTSCTSGGNAVATVSPMSGSGPSATFTITAGSAAGTCQITVSDSYGQKQTVSAVVTITQGVL